MMPRMNLTTPVRQDFYGNRAQVAEVAETLRALHKALLDALRVSFEKLHGRIEGPGAFLQLVLHDPLFAWLRPMSALIAELDDTADGESIVDGALLSRVRET